MDARIDLTENRDFNKIGKDRGVTIIRNAKTSRTIFASFPWTPRFSLDGNVHYLEELVYTGTKRQIERKRREEEFDTGLFCERCGKQKKLFGEPEYGLCHECDELLYSSFETEEDALPFTQLIERVILERNERIYMSNREKTNQVDVVSLEDLMDLIIEE